MIKETGKVIAINNVDAQKTVVVECISKSACSGCHSQSSCGVGTVAKSFSDKTHQFEIPYKKGMEVDTFIELQINNRDLISGAILAYLLPLIFFITGALIAKQIYHLNEGMVIISSILTAVVGFLSAKLITHKLFPIKQLNQVVTSHLKK